MNIFCFKRYYDDDTFPKYEYYSFFNGWFIFKFFLFDWEI